MYLLALTYAISSPRVFESDPNRAELKKPHPVRRAIGPRGKPGDRKSVPFALPKAYGTPCSRAYKKLVKNLTMVDDVDLCFLHLQVFCSPGPGLPDDCWHF